MSNISNKITKDLLKNTNTPCKEYVDYMLGQTEINNEKQKIATQLTDNYLRKSNLYKCQIALCKGTGCKSSGEESLKDKFVEVLTEKGIIDNIELIETGCRGLCELGPLVEIFPQNVFYTRVHEEHVEDIVEKTILNNEIIEDLLFSKGNANTSKIPFYLKQTRRVLSESGVINPENINESIAYGSYTALKKAIFEQTPATIVNEVKEAGLRGRGGGGFPTGVKWDIASQQESDQKYVVCNADEGDPGAFMDRSIIEADPHKVIEGMALCGYAIGADTGYVYVRAEYPLAIERLQIAIKQAEEMGLLGENIFGSDFNFTLKIAQGAGAFVCGEETALISSIEGKRGMPTVKPPYPAVKGLFGKPTNINNVETYANVPLIIKNGFKWFKEVGTEKSPGTKIFALTGKIQNTGLVEVPMGVTLRDIIFEVGGGLKNGAEFKAVQIGGPSGGCLTKEHLDMKLDFDSLLEIGAMIGSGGMVVLDVDTCMVETARFFMSFTQEESCGKCIPCREGTNRMLETLTKITKGNGTPEDIDLLQDIAFTVKNGSLCGLGKTAANPVLSTLKYFRDEYETHINDKKCPAGECKDLRQYTIDVDLCKGCSKCARICPSEAIVGEIKKPYKIIQEDCTKCGSCVDSCPFGAIKVG